MISKYKIYSKKILYSGFFKLYEIIFTHIKFNGKLSRKVRREVFGGAHVATVLPYDPIKKKILLLKQFRSGVIKRGHNPYMLEIVAGIIDKGETPRQAAIRECKEETGCNTKKIKKIYSYYPAPGSSESYYHFFLAEIKSFDGERILGEKDEDEDIIVKSYSVREVKQLLIEKKIINGVTLLALQWFFSEYYKN